MIVDYYIVQVNNNGIISFGNSFSQFNPTRFPRNATQALIAPYWADADTSTNGSGTVFFRETTNPTLLQRASRDIQDGLSVPFTPSYLLIATWDSIGYYFRRTDRVIVHVMYCIQTVM